MKKFYILIVAFGFLFLNNFEIIGQSKSTIRLGERSLEVQQIELSGINYDCLVPLDVSANNLKNAVDGEIEIISFVDYPINLYIKGEGNYETYFDNVKDYLTQGKRDYILFITLVGINQGMPETRVFADLSTSILPEGCKDQMENMLEIANGKLSNKASENNPNFVFCKMVDALDELSTLVVNGCQFSPEQSQDVLESMEFDLVKLNGCKMKYDAPINTLKQFDGGSRSLSCELNDLTSGTLKIAQNNSEIYEDINTLIGAVSAELSQATVISSYRNINGDLPYQNTLEGINAECQQVINNGCDWLVWIHFPGYFAGEGDKVAIKVFKSSGAVVEYNYTFEGLKNLSIANNEYFSIGNAFKFRNYKDEIISLLESMSKVREGATMIEIETMKFQLLSLEYNAGFYAGIGDGFIETADMVLFIAQFAVINTTNLISNEIDWWANFIHDAIKKRTIYESTKEYFHHLWEPYSKAIDFVHNIVTGQYNDYIAIIFQMIYKSAIKFVKDITFQNGSFEAGYAAGLIAFEVISEILTTGGSSLLKVMQKGGDVLKNIMKEASELMSKEGLEKLGRISSKILADIQKRVTDLNLTNLKNYLEGMTTTGKEILNALNKWPYDPKHDFLLEKLNQILSGPYAESLKTFFNQTKEAGISAWKHLTDGFPNDPILPCAISTGA